MDAPRYLSPALAGLGLVLELVGVGLGQPGLAALGAALLAGSLIPAPANGGPLRPLQAVAGSLLGVALLFYLATLAAGVITVLGNSTVVGGAAAAIVGAYAWFLVAGAAAITLAVAALQVTSAQAPTTGLARWGPMVAVLPALAGALVGFGAIPGPAPRVEYFAAASHSITILFLIGTRGLTPLRHVSLRLERYPAIIQAYLATIVLAALATAAFHVLQPGPKPSDVILAILVLPMSWAVGVVAGFRARSPIPEPEARAYLLILAFVMPLMGLLAVGAGMTLAAAPPVVLALVALGGIFRVQRVLPTRPSPVREALGGLGLAILFGGTVHLGLVSFGLVQGPASTQQGLAFGIIVLGAAIDLIARGRFPFPQLSTREKRTAPATRLKSAQRMLLTISVVSGLFLLLALGFLYAILRGLVNTAAVPIDPAVAVTIILVLGVLLGLGLLVLYGETRKVEVEVARLEARFRRHKTTSEVLRFTLIGFSLGLAAVSFLVAALVGTGQLTGVGTVALSANSATDFLVFGVLLAVGPPGFLHARELARIRGIEERLPDLLRDMAEGQRSGLTPTRAMQTAAAGHYGPLTGEIHKMAVQSSWGIPFEEVLVRFARRVHTPLVMRTVHLIVESSRMGGNVVEVLTAAANDTRDRLNIDSERRRGMFVYVLIIYVAFLVFVGVVAILNKVFLPQIADAVGQAAGAKVGGVTFTGFNLEGFQRILFHGALFQGLGSGLVAGVLERGSFAAGSRHVFGMVLTSYILFRFVLGL